MSRSSCQTPLFTFAWVLFSGSPTYIEAWQDIVATVRTGEPAWDRVHGAPFFDYLGEHPEDAKIFDPCRAVATTLR